MAELERHESAKLQLDSPEFRCFYTASQYRAAKCLELTLATTTEGTLYSDRWSSDHQSAAAGEDPTVAKKFAKAAEYQMAADMPLQKMVAEQERRAARLARQRKLDEEAERRRMYKPDGSIDVQYLLKKENTSSLTGLQFRQMFHEVANGVHDFVDGVVDTIDGLMVGLKTSLNSDVLGVSRDQVSAIRDMKRPAAKSEEVERREYDEGHFRHCRNMDGLLNQCAGELYSMLPTELPAM